MKKSAIGIDIGGTSVKLGLVDERGSIIFRESFLTKKFPGRDNLLNALASHTKLLTAMARKNGYRVDGVGIGAPGPIDVELGFVYFFPNIPGWKNTPLRAVLEKKLKMKVRVDNDGNAMALAEYVFGAGQGSKSMIALTLGTGVGGGIVLNGRLFHGTSYSAAEIGHLTINENGPACGCGSRGCIETYVGNGYFVNEVRRRLEAGSGSMLNRWIRKGEVLTPKLVQDAARAGDSFSKKMWDETGYHLGTALSGLVNILNPDRIVIGGGIALGGELILGPVRRTIAKKAFPIASRSARVLPAKLGPDAGLVEGDGREYDRLGEDPFLE